MSSRWLPPATVLGVAAACFMVMLALVGLTTAAEASPVLLPTPPPATLPPETSQPPTVQPPTEAPPTQTPPTANPPQPKSRGSGPSGAEAVPAGAPPSKFKLNSCAKIVRPVGMELYVSAGFEGGYIQSIPDGAQVRVLSGPVGSDNLWWWQFRAPDGRAGWGVGDYAEPSTDSCVAGGVSVLGSLPLTGAGSEWLIWSAVLVAVLLVVATVRRNWWRITAGKKDH